MRVRIGRRLPCLLVLSCLAASAACVHTELSRTGGLRAHAVDMIVIHAISGPKCAENGRVEFSGAPPVEGNDAEFYLAKMEADRRQVSIHYVIGRNGDRAVGVPENVIAYHAGNPDVNGRSIGIELVNDGDGKDPFPPAQIAALVRLIKDLRGRYSIPLVGIVRHSDVDQRVCVCPWPDQATLQETAAIATTYARRSDPGIAFPFDQVRDAVAFPGEPAGQLDFARLKGLASKAACS